MKFIFLVTLTSTYFWTIHFGKEEDLVNSKSVPSDVKSYHEFCTFFGLKQLAS